MEEKHDTHEQIPKKVIIDDPYIEENRADVFVYILLFSILAVGVYTIYWGWSISTQIVQEVKTEIGKNSAKDIALLNYDAPKASIKNTPTQKNNNDTPGRVIANIESAETYIHDDTISISWTPTSTEVFLVMLLSEGGNVPYDVYRHNDEKGVPILNNGKLVTAIPSDAPEGLYNVLIYPINYFETGWYYTSTLVPLYKHYRSEPMRIFGGTDVGQLKPWDEYAVQIIFNLIQDNRLQYEKFETDFFTSTGYGGAEVCKYMLHQTHGDVNYNGTWPISFTVHPDSTEGYCTLRATYTTSDNPAFDESLGAVYTYSDEKKFHIHTKEE